MSQAAAWPPFASDQLSLGSAESCIAVCCLWADRRRLARELDPSLFAAIGNLYSSGGLSALVRNLLANPRLRYLVVCGTDLTGSGASLVALFERGVDARHHVAGTDVALDRHLPVDAIEALRARITLVDLRGIGDPATISARLRTLPPLPPQGQPLVISEAPPTVDKLPSEGSGFVIRQTATAKAWLDGLKLAIDFGEPLADAGGRTIRALVCLSVAIAERPDQLFLPSWLPITWAEVERRADQLWDWCDQTRVLGGGAGVEQPALAETARTGLTHDALSWRAEEPSPLPALVRLSRVVRSGEMVLLGTFAELDLWSQFLPAMLPLRLFQHRLARGAGLRTGPLHATLEAVRLYADDEPAARTLLADRYPRLLPWHVDPRGIFHVRVQDRQIVVEHGVLDLGKTGRRYTGTSAQRLYKAIVNDKLVLLADHAAYLGAELHKAEVALQLGLPYEQDAPLDLSTLRSSAQQPDA